ncbi:MAG: hypothetical protein AB7N24_17440 [Dehalococcoidia bacterium]
MQRLTNHKASILAAGLISVITMIGVQQWLASGTPRVSATTNDIIILGSDELVAARNAAGPLELNLLEDGRLSREDYKVAVQASQACLTSNGFRIVHLSKEKSGVLVGTIASLKSAQEGPAVDANGVISYAAVGGPADSPETNARLVEDCKSQSALFERLWNEHFAESDAPSPERLEALAACLRDAGVPVPDGATAPQITELVGSRTRDGTLISPPEDWTAAWAACETRLAQ